MADVKPVKSVYLWDGGERHNFGYYVESSILNSEIEKTHPHCIIKDTYLCVYKNPREFKDDSKLKHLQSAYDKLSDMERKALGLNKRPTSI